jgi:4-hydroxy-3-polyprenylbenzoate decarboxylase
VKKLVPSITDISFPFEWIFHQSAIISLENPRPGMVRNSAAQLWALPWFTSSRILLFTAAGTDKPTLGHAAWRAINLTDASLDIIRDGNTGRIAVDATGCTDDRREIAVSDATADLVAQRWKEYRLP